MFFYLLFVLFCSRNAYEAGFDIIETPFNYGVDQVDNKNWFHSLNYSGELLQCRHINIVMYYIRKRAKYRPVGGVRITTTDCLFDDRMTSYYVAYLKRKKPESTSVTDRSLIAKYICGYKMLCNTHWENVDEVLFPMNMKKQKHWILGRLVFKERCIYVYNSMSSNVAKKSAVEATTKYSVLIPLFLSQMNFYELRSDIDLTSQPYLNKNSTDAFRIETVDDLPNQKDWYVFKFTICKIMQFC
ncbi:uncharacterized protein LOC126681411 [Mercurialis annua]|uniref:uncharacterized protein LOC126681411 n=1 Tax=Mercurialis annua TaxID=3986 RepID=UPI0024ADA3D3|nr:uncharacterized protein LOC126681411 [Mercurialis annua]